jgi:hypothetical protein
MAQAEGEVSRQSPSALTTAQSGAGVNLVLGLGTRPGGMGRRQMISSPSWQ